jgi:hypothetical protein
MHCLLLAVEAAADMIQVAAEAAAEYLHLHLQR